MPIIDERKKEQWLSDRRKYITGTDAACLLGISKWGDKFTVYHDKLGDSPAVDESEPMYWGKSLEGAILDRYAEILGVNLEFCDGYELVVNPNDYIFAASLDGWDETNQCAVDAKNIMRKTDEWGATGSSDFPEYYKAQLLVQMIATGTNHARLCALFSGCEFHWYKLDRHSEDMVAMEASLRTEAADIMERIKNHDEPPASGIGAVSDKIKAMYKVADETYKEVTDQSEIDELKALALAMKGLKEKVDEYQEKADECANRIKQILGTRSEVPGVLTWRNSKTSDKTDWKAVAETFKDSEGYESVVSANTKSVPGARTLRLTIK